MVKSSEALLAHPWISDKGPVRHFVHVHEKLQTRHGREEHVGQGHIHQEVKPMKTMGKIWGKDGKLHWRRRFYHGQSDPYSPQKNANAFCLLLVIVHVQQPKN